MYTKTLHNYEIFQVINTADVLRRKTSQMLVLTTCKVHGCVQAQALRVCEDQLAVESN